MSKKDAPRILFFDIETLPDLPQALKVWPRLSAYPGQTFKASINSVLCFGYKFLGDKKAKCINAWDFKSWNKDVNDDKELCVEVSKLFLEADAIVTQNGRKFDHKFLQTRMFAHKIPSIPKIIHIDTKVLASSNLTLFSNSLGYMGEYLIGEGKLENGGWDLWVKAHAKDPKSLKLMEKYCKQDVNLLEKIYMEFRPLIKQIPNHNLFRRDGIECCPVCGGFNLQNRGWNVTADKKHRRLQCTDCGKWSQSKENKAPKGL